MIITNEQARTAAANYRHNARMQNLHDLYTNTDTFVDNMLFEVANDLCDIEDYHTRNEEFEHVEENDACLGALEDVIFSTRFLELFLPERHLTEEDLRTLDIIRREF